MSKMNNLNLLLGELIEHSEAIVKNAKEMKNMFSEEPAALPKKVETKLSFTDLRAKLATKSRDGFTAEIKAILKSHGADKLSDIKEEEYETVLKEVEALSHE